MDALPDDSSRVPDVEGHATDAAGNQVTDDSYFDILLLGRTGMGKSTAGNNMLYDAPQGADKLTAWKLAGIPEGEERQLAAVQSPTFKHTPNSPDSTTTECELLSNDDAKLRILDIPGFQSSDYKHQSEEGRNVTVTPYQANLGIMRQIVRIQARFGLVFKCALYFLPVRGTLEKADAVIQEEIKVIRHFFGDAIFEIMVVIATLPKRQSKKKGFFEEDIAETEQTLRRAFELAFERQEEGPALPEPPVHYISLEDSGDEILQKITSIRLRNSRGLQLVFQKNTCVRCAVKVSSIHGRKVCFFDHEGPPFAYEETKCHPLLIPKYTTLTKFMGGIAHIITLGIPYKLGKAKWPFFSNSDEKCPACGMPPGAEGCHAVGEQWVPASKKPSCPITVNHSNNIDQVRREENDQN